MDPSEDQRRREEFHFVLDQLVVLGWLERWARNGDQYAYEWTAKGRERRGWLRTVESELRADERAMTVVMAVCCAPLDDVGVEGSKV